MNDIFGKMIETIAGGIMIVMAVIAIGACLSFGALQGIWIYGNLFGG